MVAFDPSEIVFNFPDALRRPASGANVHAYEARVPGHLASDLGRCIAIQRYDVLPQHLGRYTQFLRTAPLVGVKVRLASALCAPSAGPGPAR